MYLNMPLGTYGVFLTFQFKNVTLPFDDFFSNIFLSLLKMIVTRIGDYYVAVGCQCLLTSCTYHVFSLSLALASTTG